MDFTSFNFLKRNGNRNENRNGSRNGKLKFHSNETKLKIEQSSNRTGTKMGQKSIGSGLKECFLQKLLLIN